MTRLDDMDALAERTLQLAVVARALDDRSDRATRAVEHAAQQLSTASTQLSGAGERVAAEVAQGFARDAGMQARVALDAALAESRAALDAHARRVRELEAAVLASSATLAGVHRRWLVVAPALLITGCVVALVGTAAWVGKARGDVERHRVEAATLRALDAADVVRCGDRLCARIERGDSRPGGYRPIALRGARP